MPHYVFPVYLGTRLYQDFYVLVCLFFVYFLCLCATLLSPPFPCGRVCYLLLSGISYLGWRGAGRQRAYQMPRLGGSQIRLDRVFLGSRFLLKVSRSSILDIRRDHLLLPATNVFHMQPDQDGSRVFRFLISACFQILNKSIFCIGCRKPKYQIRQSAG